MTRRLAVTTVLVVAAAACTSEVASDPAPALTSTTSTTVPATTTTTTSSTTTTTTTSPPPTTTSAPPDTPSDRSFPLLVGGSEGGWLLLGSWEVDGWADDDPGLGEAGGPSIDPGTEFTAGNLSQRSTGASGAFVEACFDGRVGPTLAVTAADPDPPGYGYGAVALPGPDWPLTPRPIAATSGGPAAYRELAISTFAGDRVDATRGEIQQLVVGDLDGDGDDEALAAFEFVQAASVPGTPGDLSAVVLIDVATRNSSTVRKDVVRRDERSGEASIERSRVIDVADYNGDGVTEVAVHSWYFEGAIVTVYEYDGALLRPVLTTGCIP